MELNLQRQSITVSEVVYDGDVEQPIECDALLPDYCPDIVKILKCALTTNIGSTTLSGDRLTIEGVAAASVYYSSDGGSIRRAEYKIPFGKTIDLRESVSGPVVTVIPRVNYINCRAVNQRRIDIRGALTLSVKISHGKEEPVISDAEGMGVQLRRDMVSATEITGQSDSSFQIQDELMCAYGKPAIGNIVRTDCRINLIDHKLVSGKAVLKGELLLHISYQPVDGGALEVMKYNLPVSQILDCDGVDEDCICDIQAYVLSCDIMPKADEAGEYRIFTVDARLKASVTAHRHMDIPVASDCYSTQFESKSQIRPVSFMRLVNMVRENVLHKTDMELPSEVEAVLDAWCEAESLAWSFEDHNLVLNARVMVSLFAKTSDGDCQYFEQSTEFTHKVNVPCESGGISFEPTCEVISCDYSLQGHERIDIRFEAVISGCLYCNIIQSALGDISVDEGSMKTKQSNRLFLYFADSGESVWDIAKRYNTSANAIWEENSLGGDILPHNRMLLIPIL